MIQVAVMGEGTKVHGRRVVCKLETALRLLELFPFVRSMGIEFLIT